MAEMTTERKYRCNLCHDEIPGPFGGGEAGYGIYFKSNKRGDFEFRKIRDSENHICIECAITIRDLINKEQE